MDIEIFMTNGNILGRFPNPETNKCLDEIIDFVRTLVETTYPDVRERVNQIDLLIDKPYISFKATLSDKKPENMCVSAKWKSGFTASKMIPSVIELDPLHMFSNDVDEKR